MMDHSDLRCIGHLCVENGGGCDAGGVDGDPKSYQHWQTTVRVFVRDVTQIVIAT